MFLYLGYVIAKGGADAAIALNLIRREGDKLLTLTNCKPFDLQEMDGSIIDKFNLSAEGNLSWFEQMKGFYREIKPIKKA